MKIDRREVGALIATTFVGALSGCGNRKGADPPNKIKFRNIRVNETQNGWSLGLRTHVPLGETVRGVTLVAYDAAGNIVCKKAVGNLTVGLDEHSLQCSGFPAVISAKSDMNCGDIDIQIRYASDLSRIGESESGTHAWDGTMQRCDEDLPPERIFTDDERTETTTN